MTLPAAAARAPAAISCRSIDCTRGRQLSCRSTTAARAQVAASGRCRSTGQTDGRTPDRYIDSAPHEPTAREVPIRHFLLKYYKNIRRLWRISFKYLQIFICLLFQWLLCSEFVWFRRWQQDSCMRTVCMQFSDALRRTRENDEHINSALDNKSTAHVTARGSRALRLGTRRVLCIRANRRKWPSCFSFTDSASKCHADGLTSAIEYSAVKLFPSCGKKTAPVSTTSAQREQ